MGATRRPNARAADGGSVTGEGYCRRASEKVNPRLVKSSRSRRLRTRAAYPIESTILIMRGSVPLTPLRWGEGSEISRRQNGVDGQFVQEFS